MLFEQLTHHRSKTAIDAQRVTVETREGTVILNGKVRSGAEMDEADRNASCIACSTGLVTRSRIRRMSYASARKACRAIARESLCVLAR